MNKHQYKVQFASGDVTVSAYSRKEAEILAMAEKIKANLSYKILRCIQLS